MDLCSVLLDALGGVPPLWAEKIEKFDTFT